jgi:hypothetical protein
LNYEVKEDEITRACSTNRGKKNAYRLIGKPKGKRTTRETKT